jgi:two-component system sensor histidine kinase MtrB
VLRRVVRAWRRSILLRVATATFVLSISVLAVVGQLVITQVRDGLVDAKVSSALAQASVGFASAQARFSAAGDIRRANVGQLLTQVVTELREQAGTTNRLYDILLIPSPESAPDVVAVPAGRGTWTTGGIRADSVPAELALAVARTPNTPASRFVPLCYAPPEMACEPHPHDPVPGLAVGSQFRLGQGGSYQLYFLFPLTEEQKTLGLVRGRLAAMGVVLALLLCAIAFLVTRSVVQPVRQAARVAERIAAGRLAERMIERGEDDLARLASSFNGMASTLQRQIGQLEDLSRLQRRFVSDVSHELRTPLTTIRMAAEMIYEERSSFDPHVARSAELMYDQVDRFEALLTELLEISRYDAGAAVLEAEPVDMRDVCRRVVASVEPVARQYSSAIALDLPAEPCVVEMDPRRIERILRNLLLNALEHGEGRDIQVRVAVDADAVAVAVRDHGVGLRPGVSSLAFVRFWRAVPARARRSGGTGLGLSIAREDAHLHGGWLQAWGEPQGGAQFRLTLPKVAGAELTSSPIPLQPPDRFDAPPPGRPRVLPPAPGGPVDDHLRKGSDA